MPEPRLVIGSATSPSSIYAHTSGDQITYVDQSPPDDARERAVCRALLVHALRLLDAADKAAAVDFDEPPFGDVSPWAEEARHG